MSTLNEYFQYRVPSKFIGEIQIILSVIISVSGLTSICLFSLGLKSKEGNAKDIAIGYITYLSLALIVSISDAIFATVLISATNKISLPQCYLWRGSAISTLVLFGLLTLPFIIMIQDFKIILIFLPTLIYKPFALWVVGGFINELRLLESFPSDILSSPNSSLSLQSPRQLKRTTTIFTFKKSSSERGDGSISVVTSKIRSIPEENEYLSIE